MYGFYLVSLHALFYREPATLYKYPSLSIVRSVFSRTTRINVVVLYWQLVCFKRTQGYLIPFIFKDGFGVFWFPRSLDAFFSFFYYCFFQRLCFFFFFLFVCILRCVFLRMSVRYSFILSAIAQFGECTLHFFFYAITCPCL